MPKQRPPKNASIRIHHFAGVCINHRDMDGRKGPETRTQARCDMDGQEMGNRFVCSDLFVLVSWCSRVASLSQLAKPVRENIHLGTPLDSVQCLRWVAKLSPGLEDVIIHPRSV